MNLVGNWQKIMRRAWSIRLMILAGILSGLEVALPLLNGLLPVGPGIFAALSGLAVGAAFVARLVAQKSLSGDDE